mmetsp:Transcript_34584/g.99613  ORF Transcript_34584/g.99613 Transcript_34584/m.99613 type:complete len:393 (+) Transcript_34584:156-1334(+)
MSLSKEAARLHSADEREDSRLSWTRRLLLPWQELYEDGALACQALVEEATALLQLSLAGECGERSAEAKAAGAGGQASVRTLLGGFGTIPEGLGAPGGKVRHPLGKAAHRRWGRVAAPFLELANEDASPLMLGAFLAASGPCAATALAASSPVWLCGMALQTKGLYCLVALGMFNGAYSMFCRHEIEADRTLMHRSTAVLAISGATHLLLSLGLPPQVFSWAAHPDVVAHFLPDLVCVPLLISNLGYIAGKTSREMVPTMAFGALSVVGYVAAAAVHEPHYAIYLLGTGAVCMAKALWDVHETLPVEAGKISSCNRLRAQISADLVAVGWMGYPIVELLGLTGCISLPMQLHSYVSLDVLSKAGVSHLILRSSEAFSFATRHFEEQRRALAS